MNEQENEYLWRAYDSIPDGAGRVSIYYYEYPIKRRTEKAFWEYWNKRWPGVSNNENKLKLSANFRETKAAFLAGWEASGNAQNNPAPGGSGQTTTQHKDNKMKRISGKIHWEVVFNARNTELVQNNKKHCTIRSGHKVCENDTLRLVDDEGYTIYEMVPITRVRTVVVTYSRNCGFTMLVDGCVQTAQQAEDAAQEVGFDTLNDLGRFLLNEYRKMPDYVFSGQLISWLQVTNE